MRALIVSLLVLAALPGWAARSYTVQKGDSLDRIARKTGVSVSELSRMNNLADPDEIRPGQTLRLGEAPAKGGTAAATGSRRYTVREGDTLGEIAKKTGVTSLAIASFNKLDDPDNLREGQVLLIPAPAQTVSRPAATASPARHPLPADVKASMDRIRAIPGKWRYIVIHHTGSAQGNPKGIESYHRRRGMENGLAYHFLIGNGIGMRDGEVYVCPRWRGQLNGGHLASETLNAKSIGICLVGNFEVGRPTPRQLQSLYGVVAYLRAQCRLPTSAVKLHRQINTRPTACPGRLFPTQALQENL